MPFVGLHPADRWLRQRFAERSWLLAELTAAMDAATPIRVLAPDPCTFGHTFEIAVHNDLSRVLPHVGELAAFPRRTARAFARLAGYRPPPETPRAPWPTWIRRNDDPAPRHRSQVPACALAVARGMPFACRSGPASTLRPMRASAGFRRMLLAVAAGQEPAHLAFMTGYDHAIRPLLRSWGAATASPVLPGKRTADLLVGRTIVEIKTGWLEDPDDLQHLVDQILGYGLLSQLTATRATHVAAYLARYGVVLRYPFHALAQRSASEPIDILEASQIYRSLQDIGEVTVSWSPACV